MTRLPAPLQPIWPLAKRLHRWASRASGVCARLLSPLFGERGVPRVAATTSAQTAALEPGRATIHPVEPPTTLDRGMPPGSPAGHPAFAAVRRLVLPAASVLSVDDGRVAGHLGAVVTTSGRLDFETSPYFAIDDWREHPLYLRWRLPAVERVEGTVAALSTRGAVNSYYHFLLDALPRWGLIEQTGLDDDDVALHVPTGERYHRELLELAGLSGRRIVEARADRTIRADRLLVPTIPNVMEHAPPSTIAWLRDRFAPDRTRDLPSRLYVTRGDGPRTRRVVNEDVVWPLLAERGFVRVDPGRLSVRDQIDHFAAADVIVGIHGAALTNLVFARPGVRVLEVFAPTYVKYCYWAVLESIPESHYRYLVTGGDAALDAKPLSGIQDDIVVDPDELISAVDSLIRG